ncbi:golgin subfamily A member 6-like protein 26 [Channa argus]|uniref:golgin subfamily A member 6-like protein 26 n=1 Tax=Channa argus TaxID=215402 RepID=UPI003521C838
MEAQVKEMEEKLRAAAKIMVLKEREFWKQDRKQLLEENRRLERELYIMEGNIRKLRTDPETQKVKEEREQQEEEIHSVHERLFPLEKKYRAELSTCKGLRREDEVAEEEKNKTEQLTIPLQQSLPAQKQETERARDSFQQCKESSGSESVEEKWRRKVSKLEELLSEKEEEIHRAIEKRRARTQAHGETLAELSNTKSALMQSRLSCIALEEKFQRLLAEKEEKFRTELSEQERRFKKKLREKQRRKERGLHKELSYREIKSRMELVELCDIWQSKAQHWQKETMKLEKKLVDKEKMWNYQEAIQQLAEEKIHLQIRC